MLAQPTRSGGERMQRYKNYPIRIAAVSRHGGGWNAEAIVFEPPERSTGQRPLRAIKRLTSADIVFLEDKQEAENLALILSQAWIDGLEKAKRKT
jgi:hypothetical protein